MTFDENEIRQRLRLGEDSRTEFKEFEFRGNRPVRPERRSIADELAAFANGRGGVMFCDVTDSGQVQGMTRGEMDALEELVANLCTDTVRPSIEVTTFRAEVDGRALLLVEVPPVTRCTKVRGGRSVASAVPSAG